MSRRLELHRHGSPEAFLAEVRAFLVEREAEHNLILGLAGTLRDYPAVYSTAPYLAVVRDPDAVRLVALRTPPWNLVLSECAAPDAVALVVEDLVADGGLPGVIGPAKTAGAFAQRWSAETGCRAVLDVAERIFRLSRVVAPPAPIGMWRCASSADHRVIADWLLAFSSEALPNEPLPDDLDAVVGRWVERVGRTMYLWEADGRVVSMVGVGSPTPHGIRVGPVYTPPGERGRGLRKRTHGGREPGPARRRSNVLLPLHGPRQPDVEPHLPADRLRAGLGREHVPVRHVVRCRTE